MFTKGLTSKSKTNVFEHTSVRDIFEGVQNYANVLLNVYKETNSPDFYHDSVQHKIQTLCLLNHVDGWSCQGVIKS